MSPETLLVVVGSAVLNGLAAFAMHGVRKDVKAVRDLFESKVGDVDGRLEVIEKWRERFFVKGATP